MGSSNKYATGIVTSLCMLVFFLSVAVGSTGALPTAEDIDSLAEAANQVTETFMQESFGFRMQYEFSGQFSTECDKAKLKSIAKRAGDQLQEIAQSQRKLKQQIEDYEGRDWDSRYGSTGLWRKLFADLYATRLSRCEVDLYLALTAQQAERDKILHKILAQIDSLEQIHGAAYTQFLRAKTLALLARTDSAYKPLAKKDFDALMERSDMRHSTVFRIEIGRIKLLGLTKPDQLKTMAENITKSRCADDLELVLSLVFLKRRMEPEGLEETVKLFPQAEDSLSSLILSDLSHRFKQGQLAKEDFQQISVFEAELAVQAAWKNNPQEYKALLESLSSGDKFQTPLTLYVTAVAFAGSSPAKTVELLIKASKLQQLQKSDKLGIEADKIAQQAAQIACNLYIRGRRPCQLVTEVFDNYVAIAQGRIDEELEYLYSKVFSDCGSISRSEELLEIIANRPTGGWRNRARLDLIEQAIRNLRKPHRELCNQLRDFIIVCGASNEQQLLREATSIYCQVFLESDDESGAEKILDILTKAETADKANLNVFKSKLLWKLERPNESIECMLGVIDPNNYEHGLEAMELMRKVIEKIDQLPGQTTDFLSFIKNCQRIAEYCEQISLTTRGLIPASTARLYLAEIAVFAANEEQERLLEVNKLLDNLGKEGLSENVDLLRCRARLLSEQDKFCEAAGLWAQVSKIRKSESHSANQRSWKWWRAKFYELHCWAKCPQVKKGSILHTIDVLESSFSNIPPLWAEKISSLKQQAGH